MGSTRGLAIDCHNKPNGIAFGGRTENEVQIARVEAVDDTAVLVVQQRALATDGPISGERPFIESRRARG
jgi:hypothetical protein